uniref:Uncharacterized protein n=1 Tax=Arundo donax TaxID=35708 RepID=A0A0A9BQS1_ARUDO
MHVVGGRIALHAVGPKPRRPYVPDGQDLPVRHCIMLQCRPAQHCTDACAASSTCCLFQLPVCTMHDLARLIHASIWLLLFKRGQTYVYTRLLFNDDEQTS